MKKVVKYPLKVDIFFMNELQMQVYLMSPKWVKSELFVENPSILIPNNIYPNKITRENFERFLETRVRSKQDFNIDLVLKSYDLDFFCPLLMCMKSHGTRMNDFLWLRFNNEKITFKDIKFV